MKDKEKSQRRRQQCGHTGQSIIFRPGLNDGQKQKDMSACRGCFFNHPVVHFFPYRSASSCRTSF